MGENKTDVSILIKIRDMVRSVNAGLGIGTDLDSIVEQAEAKEKREFPKTGRRAAIEAQKARKRNES